MRIKYILLILLPAYIFSGCKKDKDLKKPDCRVITISSGSDLYNFTYNSEGKLQTMTRGSYTTTFTYSGNTIVAVTKKEGGGSYSKKIITLNDRGLASNIRTENDESGTAWTNEAYQFNGTQVIKYTATSSQGGAPTIQTVEWAGGNPVTVTSGSTVTHLEYFTDKPYQPGDYFYSSQFVLGYRFLVPKNLTKSLSDGSSITNFDYDFDDDGKITALRYIQGSSIDSLRFQYQCP